MRSHHLLEAIPVEAVRWFYGRGSVHSRTWKPFKGYDSINLEKAYRALADEPTNADKSKVIVRGDLFEVDIQNRVCTPIFWPGQKRSVHSNKTSWCDTPVQRGVWFNRINWVPIEFEFANLIEQEHLHVVAPKLNAMDVDTKKKNRSTLHKLTQGSFIVTWMMNGDTYLVTRVAQPFGRVKLRGDLSSVPINRGYRQAASLNDRKLPITHLCFVVHGIGQQLSSIRHECAKLRKVCLKVIKKHYPKLEQSGKRIEFIPVDWRTSLNLNCSTLENITIGQMRPLRMYINNCFIDVLYYTSPVYRMEIMKSLSWELLRLYNMFLRHHPQFLQLGGQVSAVAHSLGCVIMYDILRNPEQPVFVNPDSFNEDMGTPASPIGDLARRIETARSDLVGLEVEFLREISADAQSIEAGNRASFISNFRKPRSWRSLPQLSHLFLMGCPVGLFVSVNSMPPRPSFSTDSPIQTPTSSSYDTPQTPRRVLDLSNPVVLRQGSVTSSVLDLNTTDPEMFIPYSSCRRFYNIFHSYDPIAYRIEPLLLKHYSNVSPVVLPKVSQFFASKMTKHPADPKSPEATSSNHHHHHHQQQPPMPTDTDSDESINQTRRPSLSQLIDEMSESNTDNSDDESVDTSVDGLSATLRRRISVAPTDQVYKQHKSKTFKIFSRFVTRRSSHVTNLGPLIEPQNVEPADSEKRLLYRIDFEWQKSFSPLAILGAHYSYWNSSEVAFLVLYQTFGHPDEL